jgi:2-keto-4-pentenoate hydratase
MLNSNQRTIAAELLWAAERDLEPIDPLTESFPGIDVVDAYEIQLINIRRKIASGGRVCGHKVGLSSPVMQQMMGVDRQPDRLRRLAGQKGGRVRRQARSRAPRPSRIVHQGGRRAPGQHVPCRVRRPRHRDRLL